ncbi:V-type ATP synthase subunit D [Aerococcaceae bacterium NML201209]|nr:V-type ATP synthase subunit D [Aerococcaceae bacterium NML201209]MCW6665018.1 V-type ATP synthase subunit D [Aerococcaceae bacterium NML191219]MCW6666376.1 V-type ATP synthase subunit D [Aerococcaceae bacterium NML190938]MCW6675262.1 V-type ATP synthase subunit D [Aerococcaceae bacterium NML171108]MCW6676977.1 V-type ATP synthase subunit D [Aerococcaceae bacterium NML180378]MCW6680756.1 V-type ATP synthase subunit D [Aerococcaceae bacterium NML130460]MCW6682650.1 V-type ATP synthase subuni
MARLNVKPTRMELANLKNRLKTAKRGHKLLKDKRDELMRQFIDLIRENNKVRQRVEKQLVAGMQDFVLAKSLESDQIVQELFMIPTKKTQLRMRLDTIMSVKVPKMHTEIYDTAPHGEVPYSYVSSNSEMDHAIEDIASSLEDLLRLAEIEKTCQLMADEIEKTRRRVNGLEYRIMPQLEETIYYIEMKLEEAERANVTRMMKVKDMG